MTSTATTRRRLTAASAVPMTPATDIAGIRVAVDAALNDLGAMLMQRLAKAAEAGKQSNADPAVQELQQRVAMLGKIAAGLAVVDLESLPPTGAGFGSRVTVENLETGETDEYTLMVGSLLDIDTDQV